MRSLAIVGGTIDGTPAGVRAVDGTIVAIGSDVVATAGDEVVDAAGCALLAPLVNGHTHAAMTLFRGFGDDLPLMEWLETRIWPREAQLTADDVYWGTRLAAIEMARGGTARFWDMYWHGEAVAHAVRDSGLRAAVSSVVIDGLDAARGRRARSHIVDVVDQIDATGPTVTTCLGPHAVYTVSRETLTWLAELSAARELAVQIHLAETDSEVRDCEARYGMGPAHLLDACGLLGPRTVLSHCVWLRPDEFDLVAARGATIVTNPVSNLKLAVGGVFDYHAAHARGIGVGLGTDGASSNNSLDLLADAKFLALIQKHHREDPAAMPAVEAWAVATGGRAPRLGAPSHLEVGGPADVMLVDLGRPELGPGNLTANLIYAATAAVVRSLVVDGRVVVRDGAVDDEDEVRAKAYAAARRLGVE